MNDLWPHATARGFDVVLLADLPLPIGSGAVDNFF